MLLLQCDFIEHLINSVLLSGVCLLSSAPSRLFMGGRETRDLLSVSHMQGE